MSKNASPADRRGFKIPQKIAEKVFSANLRAFDQRILREKDDNFFSKPI